MGRKALSYVLVACLGLAGLLVAIDFVVTTDEERMEGFVDSLVAGNPERRLDDALGFADLDREAVELVVHDDVRFYDADTAVDFVEDARDVLMPVAQPEMELLQDASIAVDHERATVALRVGTTDGDLRMEFRFHRHDEEWLLSRVRVL